IDDGMFKLNPFQQQAAFSTIQYPGETHFYSKTNFEPSPLNRPTDSYAPGSSWAGSESNTNPALQRNVQMKYFINTALDDVKIWNVINDPIIGNFGTYVIPPSGGGGAAYPAGQLYKTITIDEHKKQVIEFKDKEGKVILKKVQIGNITDNGTGVNNTDFLCTYYIYDDLNNLRCVIQPEAIKLLPTINHQLSTTLLAEQCFRYEYDHRNRMIVKKVPGAAPVYMIYDTRDRLILTQDGKMAESYGTSDESKPPQWLYTEYDELNRPRRTSLVALYNLSWYPATGPLMLTKQFAATSNTDIANYFSGYGLNEGSEYGPAILTQTFYDNYDWAPTVGVDASLLSTEVVYNSNEFQPPYNSYNNSYPYPQPITASNATKGMVTGTLTRMLNSQPDYPAFISSVIKYDDKGRVIQTKTSNHLGGMDVVTTQYSFSNQVLMTRHKHHINTNAADPIITNTRYTYDDLGRVTSIAKRISANSTTATTAYKQTASMAYDALGQLKTKTLGQKSNNNAPLANLAFDYNIRGWLLGTNRSFLQNNNTSPDQWFGFELGYDKPTSQAGQNFTAQQYNGNIGGNLWRSQGDMVKRKYDYGYDAANRLLKGTFEQHNTNQTWNNAEMDFTTQMGDGINANTAYDYNGNILAMTHIGHKLGATTTAARTIDNLSYSYFANSNKLKAVTDNGVANNKMGDFDDQHKVLNPQDPYFADYGYDVNGNLVTDLNKGIKNYYYQNTEELGLNVPIGYSAIRYNHLNLPVSLFVRDNQNLQLGMLKGIIYYSYDAAGNKLEKRAQNYGGDYSTTTTTTSYINGFIYESKTIGNTTTYTNRLQFTGHEEGRVRALYSNTAQPNTLTGFVYDYMLKDHLGNVRMVLTEEVQQDIYPAATLEDVTYNGGTAISQEQKFYDINPAKVVFKSEALGIPNYTNQNTPAPPNNNQYSNTNANSAKLYKLNSTSGLAADKMGLGVTLKVMTGDRIDVAGMSYYFQQTANQSGNNLLPLTDVLTGFLGGASGAGITNPKGTVSVSQINPGSSNQTINNLLNDQTNQSNTAQTNPRAFINVIFFDEQFKAVGYKVSKVGSPNVIKQNHLQDLQNLVATHNGFVYIYCSNESPVNVFFDNVQVVHTRGAILEETHYYPFGLKMDGICSKAAGGKENKFLFNGKELNSKEFSDGSGLELYDFGARNYDPQIGRWHTIDPKSDQMRRYSPYNYAFDNPLRYIDPDGMKPDDWVQYKDANGELVTKFDRNVNNQQQAEEKYGKDAKDIGKSGTLTSNKNGVQSWTLNADGSATEVKPTTTTPDAANSEPVDQSTDQTATVVGVTSDIVEQGLQQGTNLATSAANGAIVGSQEAAQLSGVAKQAGALGKVFKGAGVVANAVGVVTATATLIDNPTGGNATRLAVQGIAIGAAFIPGIGWGLSLGIGIADAIWGDDFYNWIDK
ncbi:MAG: RHS repeat-associated core domain-containing protein, partial [Ferruginibacter sp.]